MRKLLFVSCLFICAQQLNAQTGTTYDKAIGIKFPGGFAISYKQFVTDNNNVEAEGMFWNKGFRAVGLYEFNFDVAGVDGLRWYVGPGAHIGFWNNDYQLKSNTSSAGFGIDGVIGLDYKLADLPLNISFDWQPAVDLVGTTGSDVAFGGIGVRYTF